MLMIDADSSADWLRSDLQIAGLAHIFGLSTLRSSIPASDTTKLTCSVSLSVCLYVFSDSNELCLSKVSGGPGYLSGQSMTCRRRKRAQ